MKVHDPLVSWMDDGKVTPNYLVVAQMEQSGIASGTKQIVKKVQEKPNVIVLQVGFF